jgi:hypothetical protein
MIIILIIAVVISLILFMSAAVAICTAGMVQEQEGIKWLRL